MTGGLGELVSVRNAGNCIDTARLGSSESGIVQLGVPLTVVIGHSRCGAVEAARNVVQTNTVHPGADGQVIERIVPSRRDKPGDFIETCLRANVDRLRQAADPALTEPHKAGD